jgi:DNA-binding transcriptional regulator GbsR (MarR family)
VKYAEAREKFIRTWETHAGSWGINRSMARVHALLLISAEPLSTEDIMDELNISRGNANMNVRDLITWGIVYRELRAGERREYFRAEKDIWKLARQIIRERRKREVEPLLSALKEISGCEGARSDKKFKALTETVTHIEKLLTRLDTTAAKALKLEESALVSTLTRIFR